jgi:2,4-dienoyl-CoA reductase-like NADH-dependent reductase (Old Yellow Enzyme family)
MIEATAVQPNGRITPEDSGIWLDAHTNMLRQHADLAHSQNVHIGIQLAHAGRKASTVAPWLSSSTVATREVGGWPDDVVGTTNEPFNDNMPTPRAITIPEIEQLKQDFVSAALRAVSAGIDVIELHFAHGYLVSTFFSPATNNRQDAYGGSFENRTRLAIEIIDLVRAAIPEKMPLFVRISATDWLEENPEYQGESWTNKDSVKLALLLADHGVDVLDVSSGGNHSLQKPVGGPGYQSPFAQEIKKAVGDRMLVSSVGSIKTGELAEEIITGGGKDGESVPLDLIAAGRMFQKNPGLVWAWAEELETTIQVAHQIGWGFKGRKKGTSQNVV